MNAYCPPGYWMTEAELSLWDKLGSANQIEMERHLGATPLPSEGRDR